jgi:hypothetical protein
LWARLRSNCRMLSCMRKIIGVSVLAVALFVAWRIYTKVAQARRETAYHSSVEQFQHDLRVGMARADVKKYLDSRGLDYRAVGKAPEVYEIKIGEEPGGPVCERRMVYVAVEFSYADTLRDIDIRKVGACL